jgi:alpha-methylacyl-CoA racemase
VYCSTSGYGQDGPHAQWAGHDLNYLAVGGFLHCNNRGPEGQPPVPGLTVADSAGGGMHSVMAILAALVRRASTGEGAYLDVSIADGVLGLMALAVDEYLATGVEPGPRHGLLTGRYAYYDTYPTRDGRWLSVAAIEPRFWANLCELLGLAQWIEHQEDDAVQDQIRADLRAVFRTRDLDDWIAMLSPADTCVAPVMTVPEIVEDEQFTARHDFVAAHDATAGDFRQVGPVFAGMEHPTGTYEARDMTTTDTDALLRAAGLAADELAKLHDAGVIA